MPKPNPNDISIGKDEWIPFTDIIGSKKRAVSFDHLITPLEAFWSALKTNCRAECCGIDAFALWPENIHKARSTANVRLLADGLVALRDFVNESRTDLFVSQRINNYFDRQVLLQVIQHIYEHAVSPRARAAL